jgi:hypothetical protein
MVESLEKTRQSISRPKALLLALGLFWLAAATAGTLWLACYTNTPAKVGRPQVHWPESSHVPRDTLRPTLVMFLHPHCPCSRASVGELALLMAHCKDRVDVHVLFLRPVQMSPEWAQTDLWREAARIPGVIVHQDDDGREARLFAAETSGDTALYDASGELQFHGGITSARGHSGDNAGRDGLQSLLFHGPARQSSTPVFGCSLFECAAKPTP